MNDSKEILNSEEVEFLLEAAAKGGEEVVVQPGSTQVVTMRGDLEQMHLADIFQTIGLAKMEGLLKVSNPVEQRMVHFRDGLVRILVPPRTATRRLGQRLVQAGLLDGEQLRLALLEQRKDKNNSPLGRILVMGGYVPQRQIDDLVTMQVTEELFGLFTWEHGEFEFYRGPVEDPAVKERLDSCPEFEINSLLLEVARRADEWEDILDALRSLDEIPLPQGNDADIAGLEEEHRTVLVAVDGRLTYRELSDITCMSVFDCARAARDLMNWGIITPAEDDHLLDIARWHHEQGHGKKALMLAQTLRDRPGERPIVVVREIAQLVRTVGESRIACHIILEAAQLQTDPELSLELANEARALSPRDLGALSFLRTTMLAHLEHDSPEVEQVTLDLLDGLLHDGDTERVLSLVDETQFLGACTPSIMVRQARALSKRKDNSAAIEVLLGAGEAYAERDDTQRQLECYELAFRLDRERKDLGKLIKQLRSTPRAKMVRWGSIAAVSLTLLASGVMWYAGHREQALLLEANTQITELISQRAHGEANLALQSWRERIGANPQLEDLEQQLNFSIATEVKERQKAAMRAAADQMQQAGELTLAGDLAGAFAIYDEMMKDPNLRAEVGDAARARVNALSRDLEDAIKDLPGTLPPPPDKLTDNSKIEATLAMLRQRVPTRLVRAARLILGKHADGGLPEAIPEARAKSLVETAEKALELLERGQSLTKAYEAASLRHETQRRLDPLFKAAIDFEEALQWDAALAAYRKLYESRAGTEALRTHLEGKVRQLEGIVGMCASIAAATKAGDFANAFRDLQALELAEPDIDFASVVRLPVRVQTSVPGAKIRWNGQEIGTTPQLVSYVPGGQNEIQLQLAGFYDVKLPLPRNHNGLFNALMTLQPTWQVEIDGIDQRMAIDSDGRVYATQRDGSVIATNARNGQRLWRFDADDLAGYLTQPMLYKGAVLIGSLDGPLRAIDVRTGDLRWTRSELATEFTPALLDGRLAIATTGGELVLLSPSSGDELDRIRLPMDARGNLVSLGSSIFVPLSDGSIIAFDATDSQMVWRCGPREYGTGLIASAFGLVAQRDDGTVSLLDPKSGKHRWQTRLPSTPIGQPVAHQDQLLVTLDNKLTLLDLRNGREIWSAPRGQEAWAGPARFLAGQFAVPTRDDSILVFRKDNQLPRYRIRGAKGVSMLGAAGPYAFVASGETLSFYRNLP